MQERPENFHNAGDDAEATLVTPRFDAEEARRAHPVVPLAEARTPAPYFNSNSRAHARRGPRRPWPPALLAVALLAVFAAGGVVASKVLRRTPPNPAAVQAPAAVAPAQAAEAEAQTPPVAHAPREVADTRPEARAPRVNRVRRAEDAGVFAQSEAARDDAGDVEDVDEDRRGRKRGRGRARVEDDGEKEIRRALKRAKEKAPRLVDVLVNPRP